MVNKYRLSFSDTLVLKFTVKKVLSVRLDSHD